MDIVSEYNNNEDSSTRRLPISKRTEKWEHLKNAVKKWEDRRNSND
jgi:hypothetical protein